QLFAWHYPCQLINRRNSLPHHDAANKPDHLHRPGRHRDAPFVATLQNYALTLQKTCSESIF
ncbi:hypothetical protein RZS08_18875, partial [Arthrospira platensis SPKY1]|nr:hypothetical protein [Arthrospira platensis SPKY1]